MLIFVIFPETPPHPLPFFEIYYYHFLLADKTSSGLLGIIDLWAQEKDFFQKGRL